MLEEISKKDEALHRVENRLVYLYQFKSDLISSVRDYKRLYKWERIKPKSLTKSDYKTNTIFSIINAKKAELLSWMQEFDFIPLSDDAYKHLNLVKKIWDFEWINSKTDKQLADVIHSSLIAWDWFMYEWTRTIKRNIREPYLKNWKVEFKDKEVIEYDWIYCEYIDWENIYFDWTNIDNSNEVVWIKHWDRKNFINSFELNPNYKNVNQDLPIWKFYYLASQNDKLELSIKWDTKNNEVISELRYYNKANDEFTVLANWVEVCSMPIPYPHKELPFCKFEDYKTDRFYSMWEYELLSEDELYKDALRSLNIDVIKAQMWFTVINPEADFDEATIEIWTNKFARVAPWDISHFSPNINANNVIQAEQAVDNDMIIKSWIDFRSQILWPWETATKTAAKTQSARKRINLNLKLNGYSFFERLARLRMANIAFLYSDKNRIIPLKWWDIDENWNYTPVNYWYWKFLVKPEYVKWKFNILPITESILWISSERDKQEFLSFIQIAWNLVWEDWKPVFNQSKIWEKLCDKWWVSFEDLTSSSNIYKSPEDLLKEVENSNEWVPNDATSPMSPDFIPPEQRSWAKLNIPTLSWQAQSPLWIVNS